MFKGWTVFSVELAVPKRDEECMLNMAKSSDILN